VTTFELGYRPFAAAPTGLQVDVTLVGGVATVRLSGELDVCTGRRLLDVADVVSGLPGLWLLEIDAGELSFVDGAGVSALLTALDSAHVAGLRARLTGRSSALRHVLGLVNVGARLSDHALN